VSLHLLIDLDSSVLQVKADTFSNYDRNTHAGSERNTKSKKKRGGKGKGKGKGGKSSYYQAGNTM